MKPAIKPGKSRSSSKLTKNSDVTLSQRSLKPKTQMMSRVTTHSSIQTIQTNNKENILCLDNFYQQPSMIEVKGNSVQSQLNQELDKINQQLHSVYENAGLLKKKKKKMPMTIIPEKVSTNQHHAQAKKGTKSTSQKRRRSASSKKVNEKMILNRKTSEYNTTLDFQRLHPLSPSVQGNNESKEKRMLNIVSSSNYSSVPSLNLNKVQKPFEYQPDSRLGETIISIQASQGKIFSERTSDEDEISFPFSQQQSAKRNNLPFDQIGSKIVKNNLEIDLILSGYQSMCLDLDRDIQSLMTHMNQQKQEERQETERTIPDVLIANFNEGEELLEKFSDSVDFDSQIVSQVGDNTNFLHLNFNQQNSIQNLAQQPLSSPNTNVAESKSLPQIHQAQLQSVDSYNTADFTSKLSMAELLKLSNQKKQLQTMRSSYQVQQQHDAQRLSMLEEGLQSSLNIILTLAQKVAKSSEKIEVDDSFLDKLEELNTIESLVDILKFIEGDGDTLLLQCDKIQKLLQRSLPVIKKRQSHQGYQTTQFVKSEDKQQIKIQCGGSPMSSQHGENLVSSALTNNRSTNQIVIPLLETFNIHSGRNVGGENSNQLTLRNQEIFQDAPEANVCERTPSILLADNFFLRTNHDESRNTDEGNQGHQTSTQRQYQQQQNHYKRNCSPNLINSSRFGNQINESAIVVMQNEGETTSQLIVEQDYQSSMNDCSITNQDLQEIFYKKTSDNDRDDELTPTSGKELKFHHDPPGAKTLPYPSHNLLRKKQQLRIDYSRHQDQTHHHDNSLIIQDDSNELTSSLFDQSRILERHQYAVSQLSISQTKSPKIDRAPSSDKEDGRIMAYLQKNNKEERKEIVQPSKNQQSTDEEDEEISIIDKAMYKFLGGFTELKSEITQLKENVMSSGNSSTHSNHKPKKYIA